MNIISPFLLGDILGPRYVLLPLSPLEILHWMVIVVVAA